MSVNAIEVKNLTKIFKLYKKPTDRLKEFFLFSHKILHEDFYALNDISFNVKKGESVGIIGKNGSGKSTLLKILTEVLFQTSGSINVDGKVASLLELGAGFNGEYNGIQNIYNNGTLLGITHEEMEEKIPEILEFADLGDYIYQPVKTYSSGMFVRLAFAIAINVEPEILIIDEALSVGDIRFQRKCLRKIEEFKKNRTFLLVSHDLATITKFCDRVIWLNQGRIEMDGSPIEVVKAFRAYMIDTKLERTNIESSIANSEKYAFPKLPNDIEVMGDGDAKITGVMCVDEDNRRIEILNADTKVKILLKMDIITHMDDVILGLTFKDKLGNTIFQINTFYIDKYLSFDACNGKIFSFEFTLPKLVDGYYTISPAIATGTQSYHVQHCWIHDALVMQVVNHMNYSLEGYTYIDDFEFQEVN